MSPLEARFTIPADHPCLAGHFPGRPVVPAVVLLDEIFAAAGRQMPALGRLRSVGNAKFLLPVLPEQEVVVSLELRDTATLEFRCRTTGGLAAQGRLLIDAPP